jgi:hypothetical protein
VESNQPTGKKSGTKYVTPNSFGRKNSREKKPPKEGKNRKGKWKTKGRGGAGEIYFCLAALPEEEGLFDLSLALPFLPLPSPCLLVE